MINLPSVLVATLITMYGINDSKNTFHGMGLIAVGMRTRKQPSKFVHILRQRSLLKAKNIPELKNFPIKWYKPDELCELFKITLKPTMQLIHPLVSSRSRIYVIFFDIRPYWLAKKRTTQARMASCRKISIKNTIQKVRYLCFLLPTCLHLMKTSYILLFFSSLIKHKHCI